MKRYKVYPEDTSFYFSTSTIVSWIPVFQKDCYFEIIINSLKYCQAHKGLYIHGYVIMPTHLHLMTSNEEDVLLKYIMRDFKHFTSNQIIECLEKENHTHYIELFKKAAGVRSGNQKYKVWKSEYHPVALTSEKLFREKLSYIHDNPARKGFVERPEQWKYSSARNWLLDDHSIIQIQLMDI